MLEAINPSGAHRAFDKSELRGSKSSRDEFRQKPRLPITVVLDGVEQNYNIGAIFRLCDAMLVEELIICGGVVDLRKRKLVQAARGTQFWVPWRHADSAAEVVNDLKARGYQIAIAELATGSIPPEQYQPRSPVCLVLGGEYGGVSPEVAALADTAIEIPLLGMANSINVATAAAIILYQLTQWIKDTLPPHGDR